VSLSRPDRRAARAAIVFPAALLTACLLLAASPTQAREADAGRSASRAAPARQPAIDRQSPSGKLSRAERPAGARQAAAPQRGAGTAAAVASTARKRQTVARTAAVLAAGGAAGAVVAAPRLNAAPARLSVGQASGLHAVDDPLDLHSAVALLADHQTGEVLFAKNSDAVLPIASITKVMTSMVVLDAGLPLDEVLQITADDIDTEKGSRSRLPPGTRLTRGELLQLALMASENRAAHALGRHYPGGLDAFVTAMNAKARAVGMSSSRFSDPTGLSGRNTASANDLARMMRAAYEYPLIRQYSTASGLTVDAGRRPVAFRNTNRLIDQSSWSIGLQKTGYISEAGRCLIMQLVMDSRPMLMVLLDSAGRHSRYGDAQRLRQWVESGHRRGTERPSAGGGAPIRTSYASAGS